MDQEVIIEYNLATIGADAAPTVGAASAFIATTSVTWRFYSAEPSQIISTPATDVAVTKITGGAVTKISRFWKGGD